MKICDICKKESKEVIESKWYAKATQEVIDRVFGKKMDMCEDCYHHIQEMFSESHNVAMDSKFEIFERKAIEWKKKIKSKIK